MLSRNDAFMSQDGYVSNDTIVTMLAAGAAVLILIGVWFAWRHRRRELAIAEPFPDGWRELLAANLPLYTRMPETLRLRLEPLVRRFLGDIRFVGCDGLQVTAEMRLIIAMQACLLIVENDQTAYRDLMSVLIYPDAFVVNREDEDEAGVVTQYEDAISGESVETARVLLSWRDIKERPADGEILNVVLHEFAHYLDHSVDGAFTDLEGSNKNLEDWHAILEREFTAHVAAVEREEHTLIQADGADHPAEFFAYSTEVFFEAPRELLARHPELYGGLKRAYGLDPAEW
jgi:Mlc titration factor MtfA (ptsG expression regulator)